MRNGIGLLIFAFSQAGLASEQVVATRAGTSVSTELVGKHIRSAPEDIRKLLVDSPERLEGIVDSLLLQEQLIAKSRELALGDKPEVKAAIEAATREVLTRMTVDELLARKAVPDFTALARERYLTDPSVGVVKGGRRIRHLLVSSALIGEDAARQRAEELLARVRQGEDFEGLIRAHSDDPSKTENDGVFLVRDDSLLDPDFSAASMKLESPGEITQPVKTQFGFHLIQLIEVFADGRQSLEKIQADVAQSLKEEWLKETRKKILEDLRSSPVEYNGDGIRSLREQFGSPLQDPS